ncbi:MAG: L,D-transpeptidase family protein [Proteobacteria bacterium]|nr:L,D-transpeptidase family protein [Pseudomonadota bacterium]
MKYSSHLLPLLALLFSICTQADVSREIRDINESLFVDRHDSRVLYRGIVHGPEFVGVFYDLLEYQPAWTDPGYVGEMITLLGNSDLEGLNPDDYHYGELQALRREYKADQADKDHIRAQFDVLLSDGILLYARHLLEGKVDPRTMDSSWNYPRRDFVPEAMAESLVRAIRERRVGQTLEQLKPDVPVYRQMKKELAHYRELADTQQFFLVPTDTVLKPRQTGESIMLLRRRLAQLGYLPLSAPESEHFGATLGGAVREFQRDHSIDSDGIVGKQSFTVLNMTFQQRVDKLRINMDRIRWISKDLSDDFILVNIAGYELHYLRNRELVWETPVMTGTINTRTPIFQKRLRYLEFNPTWTPPHSIINRSLFSKFKANPQYAVDKNYKFYDSAGTAVDPFKIDWAKYTGPTFPYRVVQAPGPFNAMGQVKFMFPNRHAVYIHDTPSKALFSRTSRAFSAGCIRVKDPLELARILLDDPENWSAGKIDALLASGKPQQVARIQRKIDVLLMYWTVSPTTSGRMQFHPDIYELDPLALTALDAPVKVIDASGA